MESKDKYSTKENDELKDIGKKENQNITIKDNIFFLFLNKNKEEK